MGPGPRRRQEGLRELHGRHHRRAGHATGQGRCRGHLPVRLASGGRRQHLRGHVSGPVPLCLRLRAHHGAAHQQHLQTGGSDPVGARDRARRRGLRGLLPAHRGRRRGRVWGRAQRLRAHEKHDYRRRRRGALRRPARRGQKVRPHGRQSTGPHP